MEKTIKGAITVSLMRQIVGPYVHRSNSHDSSAKIREKSGENPSKLLIQRVIKKAKHLTRKTEK